jgi:hypothetical protein
MKTILVLSVLFLMACGGGDDTSNTTQEPGSNPVSFLCSHEGDLWLCPNGGGGECIRDESDSGCCGSETASERTIYKTLDSDGNEAYAVKLSAGAITIIAECGSSVVFNNSEDTSSDYDANVTTTTANFGYNSGAEAVE